MKQAMTPRCPGIDAADPSPIDDRGLIGAAGIPPGDRSAECAVYRTYRRLGPAPGRRAAGVHMCAPVAHGVSARAMRAPGYRMDGTDARPYHDAGILRPEGRAGPRQSGGLTRPAKLEPPRMAPGSRLRRREDGAGSQPPAMPDVAATVRGIVHCQCDGLRRGGWASPACSLGLASRMSGPGSAAR